MRKIANNSFDKLRNVSNYQIWVNYVNIDIIWKGSVFKEIENNLGNWSNCSIQLDDVNVDIDLKGSISQNNPSNNFEEVATCPNCLK